MSKHIHDEPNRNGQVKIRVAEPLIEQFDHWVQDSEYANRSEAIRKLMARAINGRDSAAPLDPPREEPLGKAYLLLVDIANHDGVIPHEIAVTELSTKLGKRKKIVERSVIQKLRERGYLRQSANLYGERSWSLRGWDDE